MELGQEVVVTIAFEQLGPGTERYPRGPGSETRGSDLGKHGCRMTDGEKGVYLGERQTTRPSRTKLSASS